MAKILIIEDDAVMTRMYKRVFEYEGFEVHLAADGLSGFEAAKLLKPDIVLLDIMMPQMSGIQVLDAMKGNPVTEQIPVMVFTNLAGKQDAETVLGMGAVTCIHKSEVNPKQVAQMVREELSRRGVELPTPGLQVGPDNNPQIQAMPVSPVGVGQGQIPGENTSDSVVNTANATVNQQTNSQTNTTSLSPAIVKSLD